MNLFCTVENVNLNDDGYGASFVTSQNPKIGYWITTEHIYRISCQTPKSCAFEKVPFSNRLKRNLSVVMPLPNDHELKCTAD